MTGCEAASNQDLQRIHPKTYLDEFKALSDSGGGELRLLTLFGPGAHEIAALSAGLVVNAVDRVLRGDYQNAYALSRPPGHHTYLETMERLIIPKLNQFKPDLVIVACGFDAGGFDPLTRMMCSVATFREMTRMLREITGNKLVAAHEGGYSELYVPFCGHAMLEQLSGSSIRAGDPLGDKINAQQPGQKVNDFHSSCISEMVQFFKL